MIASSRWHHQMKTFSVLLALCAGNSPVTSEFPSKRPVTQSFLWYFLWSAPWINSWVNNRERSLWCHCNDWIILKKICISSQNTQQRRNMRCSNFTLHVLYKDFHFHAQWYLTCHAFLLLNNLFQMSLSTWFSFAMKESGTAIKQTHDSYLTDFKNENSITIRLPIMHEN